MNSPHRDVSAIAMQVNEYLLLNGVNKKLLLLTVNWSHCWQRLVVIANRKTRRYTIASGDDARLSKAQLKLVLKGVRLEIEKFIKEHDVRLRRYESEMAEEAEFMRFVSIANEAGLRTAVYDKGKFSIACSFDQALRIVRLIADNRDSVFTEPAST